MKKTAKPLQLRRKPNMPLAKQKKQQDRPLTKALMELIKSIIDGSDKKITLSTLAKDIGHSYAETSEWVGMWRSAPNGETTLRLLYWAEEHAPKMIQNKLKAAAKK